MRNLLNKKLLFIAYFAILFAILVAVYIYDVMQENSFKEIARDLDKKIAITRNQMDMDAFEQKNTRLLKQYADEIRRTSGLRTTMIDKQGFVLADSDVPIDMLADVENHLLREEVQEALRTGSGLATRKSATIGKHLLYYCETVKKDGRVIGFIRVAMFAPEIDDRMSFINSLVWKISVIVFLGIVIASLSFVFIYNRSQKSIYNDVTEQMNAGKFEPLSDTKREEFHQLISAINRLGNNLQEKLNTFESDQKRLSNLYNYFDEGIATFDEKGHILFYNAVFPEILQVRDRITRDKPFYYWLHFPPLVQDMEAIQNKNKTISKQTRFYGETYISYELIPINKAHDALQGSFILKVKDISIIQQLEQIRQDFITNASHELNTPLTAISGYIETLLSGSVKDKKKQEDFLKRIGKQTSLLENLIRDISDLSKSDNQLIEARDHFNLKNLLNNISEQYEKSLSKSDLKLKVDIDQIPDELKIFSFKKYMHNVISNLLDNAIQYNSPKGEVSLRAFKIENNIRIEVEDEGIGIPEVEKDRIFELFYRTEDARTIYSEGTGLGLTIVQSFVQRMGGHLEIESAIGKGTLIWFEFPLKHS